MNTPLHIVSKDGNSRFDNHYAFTHVKNLSDGTPLHLACINDRIVVVGFYSSHKRILIVRIYNYTIGFM